MIALTYATTSTQNGGGDLLMPLDDVYIHFQYGRSVAEGQPYVYNPGEPPTSGATSFLYPFVLGAGYAVGFRGLMLGAWALIVGTAALAVSLWTLIRLTRGFGLPSGFALTVGAIFAFNGATAWHFMSGMETGIIITLTLTTFAALWFDRPRFVAISAALLAMTRPEGSIMALIVVAVYGLALLRDSDRRRSAGWLALPLAAMAFQPLVNWIITGTLSASGNQAKSILGVVPFDLFIALERIAGNALRMWRDFGTDGGFIALTLPPLAVVGWLTLAVKRRDLALIALGWFVAVSVAIATLDTAFWHFKRYQMPLIALLFPLAVLGAGTLWTRFRRWEGVDYRRWPRYLMAGIMVVTIIWTAGNWREFLRLYAVNVANVAAQPYPMARWLAENTPPDAIIAVHDVGMMRYVGERRTLDMVGLTTPDAADYWRHGPGAVGEFLLRERPDYIAAYTTARGLNYLVDSPLYGDELAAFNAIYDPADNVALGAEFQGIYRVDWDALDSEGRDMPQQPHILAHAKSLIAALNVAELVSEAEYGYTWTSDARLPGFATEFYTFEMIACESPPCTISDGGRRITGAESFTFDLPPSARNGDLLLISRIHPAQAGTLTIEVNGQTIGIRQIIHQPGAWLELATRITVPADGTHGETLTVRIVPDGVVYMPYHHWLYTAEPITADETPSLATFQAGAFTLTGAELVQDGDVLNIRLSWWSDGGAIGDYKLFVHIYDDADAEPVAQIDTYNQHGTSPPGNWLAGTFSDDLMVDLSHIPAGVYQVAIGYYHAQTFERLTPDSDELAVDADRLIIDTIEIE